MMQGLPRHFMILSGFADDPLYGHKVVNLNPQPFTVEVVQHVEQPERPARASSLSRFSPLSGLTTKFRSRWQEIG
jgi:hypothetical protein